MKIASRNFLAMEDWETGLDFMVFLGERENMDLETGNTSKNDIYVTA